MSLRTTVIWTMGLLIVGVTFGLAAGAESDDDTSTATDTSLNCDEDGVFVSNWAYQVDDGRIDAVTVSSFDDACVGAEVAASVADGDGTVIASTETQEITGTSVTLPFPDTRPSVVAVEQFTVFIVGAGDPPDEPPPPEPPPNSVLWDGEGPSVVECDGEVVWTLRLTGDLRGIKAEMTGIFASAGQVGPVAAQRSGGGPNPDLIATLTTPSGDVLEQAWATLTKAPDQSMSLTLDDAVCSSG